MSEFHQLGPMPDLVDPLLVVAVEGFIDAGGAAATATDHLRDTVTTALLATLDTDEVVDRRARRPALRLHDGRNEGLELSPFELRHGRDASGSDLLLLSGPEPDFRWRATAQTIVDLARHLGVVRICGLGAYPAPTPHTRPTRVVGTATTDELAVEVGFLEGQLEVPASFAAMIEAVAAEVGIPAVGLWAQVPHYASNLPAPGAAVALIQTLDRVNGTSIGTEALEPLVEPALERIAGLVANSEEAQRLVDQLERYVDALSPEARADLPTGEDLADEIERFLRDRE